MSKKVNIILTAIQGGFMQFHEQHEGEQRLVKRVLELSTCSAACGASTPNGAIVYGSGNSVGFSGNLDAHSAVLALNDAVANGNTRNVTLAVTVADNRAHAPLPDDVLEALVNFDNVTVLLVGPDRSVVVAKASEPLAA